MNKSQKKWNPRYVAYAAAHGETPESMAERDKRRGWHNTGFMLWINERWSEWHAARGLRRYDHVLSEEDHASFDAWLPTVKTPLKDRGDEPTRIPAVMFCGKTALRIPRDCDFQLFLVPTDGGASLSIRPARYAKRKALVAVLNKPSHLTGLKCRAERLMCANDAAARYTHRERGFVMSPAAVERLLERIHYGYDADYLGHLQPPQSRRQSG